MKPWWLKSLLKENPLLLLDKIQRDNSMKTNKPLISKRRERKMLPLNSNQPHLEKNKRKRNVMPSEPSMLTTQLTDNKKSPSSDKLRKSLPPSFQELRSTFKRDHLHEFYLPIIITILHSFNKYCIIYNNY